VKVALTRRRALRHNGTDAEAVLWFQLRAKRLSGFKFRRQHPCGPYILDFYCPRKHLAVELDGGQHFEPVAQAYDERRTAYLRRRGVNLLRFTNDVVFTELDAVLDEIARVLVGGPDDPPESW
jgi:very-short-patch-repair endonuclease